MIQKKGVVSQQFHWIFVLFAGGLIVMLFVQVATVIQQTELTKVALDSMNQLDAIFTGSATNEDITAIIKVSEPLDLYFTCEYDDTGYFVSEYGLLDPDVSAPNDDVVIFSQEKLSDAEIITDVRTFSTPFRTDRMLFIGAKTTTLYVLMVDDDEQAASILSLMPTNLSYIQAPRYLNEVDRDAPNTQNIVLVATDENKFNSLTSAMAQRLRKLSANSDIKARVINLQNMQVDFWELTEQSRLIRGSPATVTALNNETLLGALMVEDSQSYLCNMKKLDNRLKAVTTMHRQRIANILPNMNSRCVTAFGFIRDDLDDLLSRDLVDISQDISIGPRNEFNELVARLSDLRARAEVESCPEFY